MFRPSQDRSLKGSPTTKSYTFLLLVAGLSPIIAISGCSDEPVSGSMEIASSNLEGAFEAPPPSRSSSSEIARNQLLRNGWSIKTIDANEGSGYSVSTQYNTRDTISDKDIELINTLGNVQTLALSQSDDPIDFSNAALAQLRGNKSIETLHIGWSNINDHGMEHLKFLPNLERLYVDSPFSMTDLGMEHIQQIKGLRKLSFRIEGPEFTEMGFKNLSQIKSLESLTIYIKHDISSVWLAHLSDLSALKALQIWSWRFLHDEDFQYLSSLEPLTSLTLHSHGLTGEGIKYFQHLPRLRSLSLTYAKVTEPRPVVPPVFPRLESLSLSVGGISDDGFEYLSRFSSLRELKIGSVRGTEAGFRELAAALPELSLQGAWKTRGTGELRKVGVD